MEEMLALHDAGETVSALARKFDRDRGTITRYIRATGRTIKPWHMPKREFPEQEICDLITGGATTIQVAHAYKTSREQIHAILKRHGVAPRYSQRRPHPATRRLPGTEIRKRYAAGETIAALSRAYVCDRRTIYKALGKGNLRK